MLRLRTITSASREVYLRKISISAEAGMHRWRGLRPASGHFWVRRGGREVFSRHLESIGQTRVLILENAMRRTVVPGAHVGMVAALV